MEQSNDASSDASPLSSPSPSSPETLTAEDDEPPQPGRHPRWQQIPLAQWEDWRWQSRNAIRTTDELVELLPHSELEVEQLRRLEREFKLAIPPYYFSLIETSNPSDPIRLQAVPSALELTGAGQLLEDPLEEDRDSPVPGLTHRYPDRVLLVSTPVCSMYCRFCTRKRVTMDRDGWDGPSRDDLRVIEYITTRTGIHDVILSGGDPLTLPVARLRWLLDSLTRIPHVDMVRIGTRVPVTLPQRLFDPELVTLLGASGKVWIQTHFNHPRELTPEAARAVKALHREGLQVNNQTVLLKGVNDSVPVMRDLIRGLLRMQVRPYYLFHCDPVMGASHFRTSVWKGIEIIEGLRGHVSGLGVPTYVVDGVHGAGKIPLMPNYLVSAMDGAVVLRNYEGVLFRYAAGEAPTPSPAERPFSTQGVSALLQGSRTLLASPEVPRLMRRDERNASAGELQSVNS